MTEQPIDYEALAALAPEEPVLEDLEREGSLVEDAPEPNVEGIEDNRAEEE